MIRNSVGFSGQFGPILGAVKSVPVPHKPHPPADPRVNPFITITRQPAVSGGWAAANQLLDALNAAVPGDEPWTCWDRELIEKVAVDLKLPARVVERLEDRADSWFSDFFGSLYFNDAVTTADTAKVYTRVSEAIRALAQKGRVVIVGRGGVFLTHKLPGGIHVRLVAPFEHRVANVMKERNLTFYQAAALVKKMDHDQQHFYRQHWPNESLSPEKFALTINTAEVEQAVAIEMITALARLAVRATK